MFPYEPVNNHEDLLAVVDGLLREAGLSRSDFGGEITFAGMDPIRPTHIKVGCASAAVTGANAIASAIIWKRRSGQSQDIHIDLRKAYVTQSPWQDILAKCTLVNVGIGGEIPFRFCKVSTPKMFSQDFFLILSKTTFIEHLLTRVQH